MFEFGIPVERVPVHMGYKAIFDLILLPKCGNIDDVILSAMVKPYRQAG